MTAHVRLRHPQVGVALPAQEHVRVLEVDDVIARLHPQPQRMEVAHSVGELIVHDPPPFRRPCRNSHPCRATGRHLIAARSHQGKWTIQFMSAKKTRSFARLGSQISLNSLRCRCPARRCSKCRRDACIWKNSRRDACTTRREGFPANRNRQPSRGNRQGPAHPAIPPGRPQFAIVLQPTTLAPAAR